MSKNTSLTLAVASLIILFLFVQIVIPRLSTKELDFESVTINNTVFKVMIADEHNEHTRGLSGIEQSELLSDGMLFVFDDLQERYFWMNDMNFALDIVWIARGEIVKIEENVEIFNDAGEVSRINSEPFEVDMVLELPSGSIEKYGIYAGDLLKR